MACQATLPESQAWARDGVPCPHPANAALTGVKYDIQNVVSFSAATRLSDRPPRPAPGTVNLNHINDNGSKKLL
jgi:hypothetical protein